MTPPDGQSFPDELPESGPLATYRRLIAENDALIRSADLENGRAIVTARTAIHTVPVGQWAEAQQRAMEYDKPFAVVALGGTGRAEVTPYSDLDFAFLFDEAIEGNAFLLKLQRQTLHTGEFQEHHGFCFEPLPFGLDDVPSLVEKQLNSFLDMRPVYDPCGLADRFRERIRATFDPFQHFLHLRGFWDDKWEIASTGSSRLDRFDIKNDGLRVFLAGIWALAAKNFIHSHDVYRGVDPRDLAAYDFLLRIRAWVHSRRPPGGRPDAFGNHPEDVLRFDDSVSYGEMLGAESAEGARFEFADTVRSRLLSARRRVAVYARGVIERELRAGREVAPGSPIIYGSAGLFHAKSGACASALEKSRAALSLLLASQRYGVEIDPAELHATFANAGDWLVRVPEVAALFYEPRGSLADSFEFLSQLDGTEERLFPGYGKFESSLDARVMTERLSLRGALERQKMRVLERYVAEGAASLTAAISPGMLTNSVEGTTGPIQAALLDADHLAAVKLALKTKRLPVTAGDEAARADRTRPLHERHASGFSGIPLAEYFAPGVSESGFTTETVETAKFLLANRRAFKELTEAGMNDREMVQEFVRRCGDEQRLRALFVFTCADRAHWESAQLEPVRWFNIRELYDKALLVLRPGRDGADSLKAAGYAEDELSILRDFGDDFFGGLYRLQAIRFGEHLVRLSDWENAVKPKAAIIRDGTATMLGVAARDFRGLAATISGALWHCQVELQQAHLFSAMHHGLALDFFHLHSGDKPLRQDLSRIVEEAIESKLHIAESDEAGLPRIEGKFTFAESSRGLHRLSFETAHSSDGLIYALTYKVFRYLGGDIYGLTAHSARGNAYISIYFGLPSGTGAEEAKAIVEERFGSSAP